MEIISDLDVGQNEIGQEVNNVSTFQKLNKVKYKAETYIEK